MNKYKAFYKSKETTVEAATSYSAQKIAAEMFKAKKNYDVSIYLIEKEGKEVRQSTQFV